MTDRIVIWCTGGFTAGCLIGAIGARTLFSSKAQQDKETELMNKTMEKLQTGSRLVKKDQDFMSNMTLMLGSPTASGFLDTLEYPLYAATENYPELECNRSLMARYLTTELYEDLSLVKTSSGFSIDQCIQTGVDNPDKISCGIVAGDEECYDIFLRIFDPVITDRHRGFKRGLLEHERDLSIQSAIDTTPFNPIYVKSTHFLVGRCIHGFRFPPSCSRAERKHLENLLKVTLESLKGDFEGEYQHLCDLSMDDKRQLPDILQSISDRPHSMTLQCSGSTRDWPHGRGIFHNKQATLFAWTNREDHLRVMYRERKMNFAETFQQFCKAMDELGRIMEDHGVEFVFHKDYGYLLTCPSGIGTALRAGVHMKLPHLLQDSRFRSILKNLRLHMGADDQEMLKRGYVDVYNMDRLGYKETHLVQHVADAVHRLCEMEKRLEGNESINDLLLSNDTLED